MRVGSPGGNRGVSQTNAANADATHATATTTGESNVDVTVDVEGSGAVTMPSNGQAWTWTWTWTLGSAPVPTTAASTDGKNWNWNWSSPPSAVTTQPPDAIKPVFGHWIWRWTWTNGDQSAGFVSDQGVCLHVGVGLGMDGQPGCNLVAGA